jgi:hypothetical protein
MPAQAAIELAQNQSRQVAVYGGQMGSSSHLFEQGEIGPDLFRNPDRAIPRCLSVCAGSAKVQRKTRRREPAGFDRYGKRLGYEAFATSRRASSIMTLVKVEIPLYNSGSVR